MSKQKEKEATTFYCPKDSMNVHHWESIGVVNTNVFIQVFKCSQCKKIRLEVLEKVKFVLEEKNE